MAKAATCSVFFLLLAFHASGQTVVRHYDVISDDEAIGTVVAMQQVINDKEYYHITCEMTVRMVFKVHVSYNLNATFEGDLLTSSAATVYLNHKVQNKVKLEKSGANYVMVKDGDTEIITEPITYSSAKLYFYLPEGDKKVFSETDGIFKTLKRKSTYSFELTDPDNSSHNSYTYVPNIGLLSILVDRQYVPTFLLSYVRETVSEH